jgi:hypothetical protein
MKNGVEIAFTNQMDTIKKFHWGAILGAMVAWLSYVGVFMIYLIGS